MRWALSVFACVFAASAFAAGSSATAPAIENFQVEGRAYQGVVSWGRAAGLDAQWLKRDEEVRLSGPQGSVVMKADSREARVNGVQVWLSFPVVSRNGALWVSRSDTQYALNPLLARRANPAARRVRSVCLDPGHGGKDAGYQAGERQEKTYTLLLACEVRNALAAKGIKVTLTRGRDEFVDLPARPAVARSRKADVFLSLHFNSAAGNAAARGVETYCLTPPGAASTNARGEAGDVARLEANSNNDASLLLAYSVQETLLRKMGVEDRGVRRARFAVLREAPMPAVLVEAGFMSHAAEGKKIADPAYRRQLAAAIVDGIVEYNRRAERRS